MDGNKDICFYKVLFFNKSTLKALCDIALFYLGYVLKILL